MPESTTESAGSPTDTADPSTGGAPAASEAIAIEEPPVPDDVSDVADQALEDESADQLVEETPAVEKTVDPADQPAAEPPVTEPETDQVDVEGAEAVDGPDESASEWASEYDDEPASRAHRRTMIMVLLAIVVLAVDQISKSLVVAKLTGHDPVKVAGGAVYLLEVTNKGAAFSLGEGYTALFTAVAAAVVVVMVRVSSRLSSTGWAVALGLVLGGAAGNLGDRLFRAPGPLRGAVVDWISLFDPEGRIWPVFNLADSAIVCGGIGAVILMLLGRDLTVQSRRD